MASSGLMLRVIIRSLMLSRENSSSNISEKEGERIDMLDISVDRWIGLS